MVPGTSFDSARVEALLEARGAALRPDGSRTWMLQHGAVELRPLREGGQWVATEVRVPLSDRTELIREAVAKAAELATEAEVRLFDPQLGRALSAHDDADVTDQYLRTARYAGEMLGLAEALPVSDGTDEGFQPTTKVLLGIIGVFVLLYLLMNWLDSQLIGGG
jgi:hypothetical protein